MDAMTTEDEPLQAAAEEEEDVLAEAPLDPRVRELLTYNALKLWLRRQQGGLITLERPRLTFRRPFRFPADPPPIRPVRLFHPLDRRVPRQMPVPWRLPLLHALLTFTLLSLLPQRPLSIPVALGGAAAAVFYIHVLANCTGHRLKGFYAEEIKTITPRTAIRLVRFPPVDQDDKNNI
jgi:hypothetical protein